MQGDGGATAEEVLSRDAAASREEGDASPSVDVTSAPDGLDEGAQEPGDVIVDRQDTPPIVGCGDGACSGDESCEDCPEDCPICVPEVGAIVISEVMKDPAAVMDSQGEWIELVNVSDEPIDMRGMVLRDEGSDAHTISPEASLIIAPGAYLVMGVSADLGVGLAADEVVSGFMLDNDADEVILQAGERVLDALYYDDVDFVDPVGASLNLNGAMAPSAEANDAPGAWCAAVESFGEGDLGTPGAPNTPCDACGDSLCGETESCESCPQDCGACTPCALGGEAFPESCNGIDDDCDDLIDESTCADNLGCTTDECVPGEGCVHTPAPGGCALDGYCISEGAYNPQNPCQLCDVENSQVAWTNENGSPCNDGTPCTNNDLCVQGSCIGSPVEDDYEHNDTRSTAVYLGEAKDNTTWSDDASLIWASLYGEGDVDWYQYKATDTFWGKIRPRVDLVNVPRAQATRSALHGVQQRRADRAKSCFEGEETTSAEGLPGCCSTGSAKLELNCEGSSDDGTVFVSVSHKSGPWTCDNYSIMWGDD